MNARGKFLTPGREYKWQSPFAPQAYFIQFVRRIPRECGHAPINVFVVPEFVGLNGPEDKGITEFSDYKVRTEMTIAQPSDSNKSEPKTINATTKDYTQRPG